MPTIQHYRLDAPDVGTRAQSLLYSFSWDRCDNPLLMVCEIGLDDDVMTSFRTRGAPVTWGHVMERFFIDIGAGTPDPAATITPGLGGGDSAG